MSPLIKMMGTIALGFIVCLEAASPLLAASRSHSVDVSCVVKPVFQISSPANKPVESVPAFGSLGGFQPTERPELLEISSNLISLINHQLLIP